MISDEPSRETLEFALSLIQHADQSSPVIILSPEEASHCMIAENEEFDEMIDLCLKNCNRNTLAYLPHLDQLRTLRISSGHINLEVLEPSLANRGPNQSVWHSVFPAKSLQELNPRLYQEIVAAGRVVRPFRPEYWHRTRFGRSLVAEVSTIDLSTASPSVVPGFRAIREHFYHPSPTLPNSSPSAKTKAKKKKKNKRR